MRDTSPALLFFKGVKSGVST